MSHPRDMVHLWIEGKGHDVPVCYTCIHWEPEDRGIVPLHGQCRRNPPSMPRMGSFGEWPRTRRYDFCGFQEGALDND